MSVNNHNPTKIASLPRAWYVVSILAVVLVIILLLLQGWLRNSAFPRMARAYHGYEASLRFKDEVDTLKDPLRTLGFKNVTSVPARCASYQVYGYDKPQLQCIAEYQNYVVIGNDEKSKSVFNGKAKELDQLMNSDNWTTTSHSASSIGQWFEGITSGKDWYTDIDSIKNVGNEHCSLVFNVAYANPKPPAFEVRMSCAAPVLEKSKDRVFF